jgi:hypothetical protein
MLSGCYFEILNQGIVASMIGIPPIVVWESTKSTGRINFQMGMKDN